MSFDYTKWGWSIELPSTRKLVFLAICNRADETGFCYPTVQQIAKDTGLKDRAIRQQIKELEKSKIITAKQTRKTDGRYGRFNFQIHRHEMPSAYPAVGTKQQKPSASRAEHNLSYKPIIKDAIASDSDFVWSVGLEFLTSTGNNEKASRSMLGRWLKEAGGGKSGATILASAIRATQDAGTQNPIPYISKVLKNLKAKSVSIETATDFKTPTKRAVRNPDGTFTLETMEAA